MPPPFKWKTAWITGASTGIGRELALKLAQGGVKVACSARSADKLAELASLNPNILPVPLDVADKAAVAAAHARIVAELGPIDLCILNAGIWQPMGGSTYQAQSASESMTVNYLGIANALEPLLPPMIASQSGHVALVASVAGYRGLPKAAAYAPSKAAVISLAEVLRPDLARSGVTVSLINPGFVATPMTAVNTFPMPFMVDTEFAANAILSGLERGKFEIAFPWQLVSFLKLNAGFALPALFLADEAAVTAGIAH